MSLLGCGDGPDQALSGAKELVSFSILSTTATPSGQGVLVTLPFGTEVTALVPTIVHTGASISPESGVAQNFSRPVTYTVTAEDGSAQSYVVTVTTTASDAKSIDSFSINGVAGTITGTEIAVVLPFGTDLTALSPRIGYSGVSINPAASAMRNFSSPVQYTVTAADGSTQTYTVTVTAPATDRKDILSFIIDDETAVISGTEISLELPVGTDLTSLVPTIEHTGISISPPSETAQDFTSPVQYVVTASDGSTKAHTVTVTIPVAPSSEKHITRFVLGPATGIINGTEIAVTMPLGSSVTALTPVIVHSGTSISPAVDEPRDFSVPVLFTVTARDGSTRVYTVTVTVATTSTNEMLAFEVGGVAASITHDAGGQGSVTLQLPPGMDRSALTPFIAHNGVSVSPGSGVPRDFSNGPVSYQVTGADGEVRQYSVVVLSGTIRAPRVAIVPPGQTADLGIELLDHQGALDPASTYSLTNTALDVATVSPDGVVSGLTVGVSKVDISSEGRLGATTWVAVRPVSDVAANSTTDAEITESDALSPFRSPGGLPSLHSHADVYRLTLEAGEVHVAVDTGDVLDTHLFLADPGGVVVAENDDDVEGLLGRGSRIRFQVPAAGTYFLDVSTFSGVATGSYRLSVTQP